MISIFSLLKLCSVFLLSYVWCNSVSKMIWRINELHIAQINKNSITVIAETFHGKLPTKLWSHRCCLRFVAFLFSEWFWLNCNIFSLESLVTWNNLLKAHRNINLIRCQMSVVIDSTKNNWTKENITEKLSQMKCSFDISDDIILFIAAALFLHCAVAVIFYYYFEL